MGFATNEMHHRLELVDVLLDVLVERSDPDDLENARKDVEDFIEGLSPTEVIDFLNLAPNQYIEYSPEGDFTIEYD